MLRLLSEMKIGGKVAKQLNVLPPKVNKPNVR